MRMAIPVKPYLQEQAMGLSWQTSDLGDLQALEKKNVNYMFKKLGESVFLL